MASELRVNSSTNRSGLGTITYTDSGPIVSGVGTFANGLTVDGTQTTVKSLKLTGDNYNVNWFKTTNKLRFNDNAKATFGTADDLSIYHDGNHSYIDDAGTGNLRLRSGTLEITNLAGNKTSAIFSSGGGQTLNFNNNTKFVTTNTGAIVTGVLTATSFSGTVPSSSLSGALPAISGANLTNLPPSAPVGGASTNQVFFENDKLVEVNYQITSTKNAMSAGPISVSAGIAVTIPSGCSWTIV